MITAVTYLNTDLIKVTLSERARIDSDFLKPSNWVITASYEYSTANNVQVVSVLRPTDDSIVATDTIFLQTTTHSPSTIYRLRFVTLTNTEGLPFISYLPRVFPYRSRQTKIDQILKSTPSHFDKRTTSNIRNILTAISIEDDLIGGSRNDAFESLVVLGGGGPIEFIAPFFIIIPTITGGTTPGDLLTCDPGTWGGTNPIAFNFQWRRDGVDIVGETLDLYTTVDADGGTDITCFVTLVNFVGTTSAESNAIAVTLLPPVFVTSPVVSGTYSIGSVLTCAPGTWTGTELITVTYQWHRDGVAIGGEDESTYTLVGADMRGEITCEVTITNGAGSDVDTSNALSWADYIAPLVAKCWVDAQGGTHLVMTSAPLIDSATDLSGESNSPAASGGDRPSYDPTAFGGRGGMLFSGAQRLVTPAFLCQPDTSGCVYWDPSGTHQSALEFGPLNSHILVFSEIGFARVRAPGTGDNAQVAWTSGPLRVTWRTSTAGVTRALFNGVEMFSLSPSTAVAQTDSLRLGEVNGFYSLIGAIGEVVFSDTAWSDAEMDAVDAAMAARWI